MELCSNGSLTTARTLQLRKSPNKYASIIPIVTVSYEGKRKMVLASSFMTSRGIVTKAMWIECRIRNNNKPNLVHRSKASSHILRCYLSYIYGHLRTTNKSTAVNVLITIPNRTLPRKGAKLPCKKLFPHQIPPTTFPYTETRSPIKKQSHCK